MLGNADSLKILETVHFELKGTPASSEIQLLTFLLDQYNQTDKKTNAFSTESNWLYRANEIEYEPQADTSEYPFLDQMTSRISKSVTSKVETINQLIEPIIKRTENLNEKLQHNLKLPINSADPFIGMSIDEIVHFFFNNIDNPEWHKRLTLAFLSRFISHHREYSIDQSFVASGK